MINKLITIKKICKDYCSLAKERLNLIKLEINKC